MAGERGEVLKSELVDEGVDVTVDTSGDGVGDTTAEHYTPPGIDALPLPGDEAIVEEVQGQGNASVCAYQDLKNKGKAAPGEIRNYARDANGNLAAEVWVKGNGDVEIKSVKTDGKIILNGVIIDQQGNVIVPGDVTWMAVDASSPAPTANKASTHTHGSGTGPTTKPIPGT